MERPDYVLRGGSAGRERLRILARVLWPTTETLLDRVGLREGTACLDVGCGGGDVTVEIARLVGPGGSVIGIDMDPTKIDTARREAAARRVPNVSFRVADATHGDVEGPFDVVYLRFLLTHLKQPESLLARLRPLVRPGGRIVVEDIDFRGHFCHPQNRAFQRYVELYTQVVRRRGCDPEIGPRLPSLLLEAGFGEVGMNVVQPAAFQGETKQIASLTMANIADAVVAEGLATAQEIAEIVGELDQAARDDRTVMSVARVVQSWGRAG
jgi:SAM-dependent methyltransferase